MQSRGDNSLGTAFRGNTIVRKFKELRHFTSLTIINNYAFYNCSVEEIDIPNFITMLEWYAFAGASLKNVVLPASVTKIGDSCFRDQSSRNILQTLTMLRDSVVTLSNRNAFLGQNITQIYVPSQLVDAYKADSTWSSLASRIHPIPAS